MSFGGGQRWEWADFAGDAALLAVAGDFQIYKQKPQTRTGREICATGSAAKEQKLPQFAEKRKHRAEDARIGRNEAALRYVGAEAPTS